MVWVATGLLVFAILLLIASFAIKIHVEKTWPPIGQFAEIDGMYIHYLDVGAGEEPDLPPIVFLHGANSNLRDHMIVFRPLFEGRGRLIFVDRPGCGYSTRTDQNYSDPALQSRTIAGLLDHLKIDQAIICGHSLGAAITAAFGVYYREKTVGLMFLAPATHPWPLGVAWYYRLINVPVVGRLFCHIFVPALGWFIYRKTIKSVFSPNIVPENYTRQSGAKLALRGTQFYNNAMDVANLNTHVARLSERYSEIDAPTVIITGDKDDIVMAEIHSQGLKQDINGAELFVLPGIGHKPDYFALEEIVAGFENIAARANLH
jgi:pimeloyl-ACP methyl ester carboxylesterase